MVAALYVALVAVIVGAALLSAFPGFMALVLSFVIPMKIALYTLTYPLRRSGLGFRAGFRQGAEIDLAGGWALCTIAFLVLANICLYAALGMGWSATVLQPPQSLWVPLVGLIGGIIGAACACTCALDEMNLSDFRPRAE